MRTQKHLFLLACSATLAFGCTEDDAPELQPDTADTGNDTASDASLDIAADALDTARDASLDTPTDDAAEDAPTADIFNRLDTSDAPTEDALDVAADAADVGETSDGIACTEACGVGSCDGFSGTCQCPSGTYFDGGTCAEVCDTDCDDRCPAIVAPTLYAIAAEETLSFSAGDRTIEAGIATDLTAGEPDEWLTGGVLSLTDYEGQDVRVFARVADDTCVSNGRFNAIYRVRATYPGPPDTMGSTAVPAEDGRIIGWASTVLSENLGSAVADEWRDTDNALGAAGSGAFGIVSLGDRGSITLGFDEPISDGPGFDLAVFENGFADDYLEFAFVEVSSDGETFVRFDGATLNAEPPGPYGYSDTTLFGQIAGKYRAGFGAPFDLAQLRQHAAVLTGTLDLQNVTHVRIVDAAGDGDSPDAFGRPVLDPHPTQGSVGFDLDAVAVLGGGQ